MSVCQSPSCMASFEPRTVWQKYCSPRCQNREGQKRKWKKYKEARPPKISMWDKFWANVSRQPEGCWLWTGYRAKAEKGKLGYGRCSPRSFPEYMAHRCAWHLVNGPIPKGLQVLHKCDVPNCVRPDHLFLGTHTDNMRDCNSKGRRTRGKRGRFTKNSS